MKTKTEDIRKRVEVIDSLVRYPDGCIPFYTYELIYIIGWLLDEREEIKEKTMKTKAIKRCIDNGSDVRDALAAQVELYAIEAEYSGMATILEVFKRLLEQGSTISRHDPLLPVEFIPEDGGHIKNLYIDNRKDSA